MRSWKAAGRAARADEDELWARFKTAQDTFFRARSEVYSAKDAALREHAEVKTQLLEEAGKLVPVTDVRAARAALRGIQERWEQAGPVPREAHERLESGLRRIEDAVRKAEDAQWRRSNPEALARARGTVDQLRTAITGLEEQLAKAQGADNARAVQEAQEALDARRSWLVEAERTLAEFTAGRAAASPATRAGRESSQGPHPGPRARPGDSGPRPSGSGSLRASGPRPGRAVAMSVAPAG